MRKIYIYYLALVLFEPLYANVALGYVLPQLGGGSVSQAAAPMKHISVSLSGTQITLDVDNSVDTPLLRALEAPDEFDPAAAWSVLQAKDHNFQFGWLVGGVWSPPPGSGVWVEELSATSGLETYYVDGLLVSNTYNPIFGTAGSSSLWQWNGAMTHNAYAVSNPTSSEYEATYRVYIGDVVSGAPTPGYQAAEVTLSFDATPNLTADFNEDGYVDGVDLNTWQTNYGASAGVTQSMGDADLDGDVDGLDFMRWQEQYTGSPTAVGVVPEPESSSIALIAALSSCYRFCGRASLERLRR